MHNFSHTVIAFITVHPGWAVIVIAATAFGESFAFAGLFFPGTTVLAAAGILVGAGKLNPVTTILAGSIGAILGDAISYWIGQRFAPAIPDIWPFRSRPKILERGIIFFKRYGWASVFIGRFFGPLRAVVTIAAGMMQMRPLPFYIANILSAIIWAPAIVLFGALLGGALASSWSIESKIAIITLGIGGFAFAAYQARRLFDVPPH